MALTATQKLKVKQYLKLPGYTKRLDPTFTTIEADADLEAELVAAITEADTAKAAVVAAQTNADELTAGEGAEFNHLRNIAIKNGRFRETTDNIARIMGISPSGGAHNFVRF